MSISQARFDYLGRDLPRCPVSFERPGNLLGLMFGDICWAKFVRSATMPQRYIASHVKQAWGSSHWLTLSLCALPPSRLMEQTLQRPQWAYHLRLRSLAVAPLTSAHADGWKVETCWHLQAVIQLTFCELQYMLRLMFLRARQANQYSNFYPHRHNKPASHSNYHHMT